MQTRFLKEVRLSELKQKQIHALATLPEGICCKLIEFFQSLEVLPVMTPQRTQELAQKLDLSGKKATDVYSALSFLLSNMGKFVEQPVAIAKDLIDSGTLTEEEGKRIESVLDRLSAQAAPISLLYLRHEVALAGGSSLRGISTTVALKPIFRERYVYDQEPVTKYSPELIAYVAVAQIEMGFEDITSESRSVTFQVTEEGLDRLISDLVAMQSELKLLKKTIPLKA